MTVWDRLVGQDEVVAQLRRAVADAHRADAHEVGSAGMTHAWLIIGPPGSGRSLAAVSFATALVCDSGGCGTCRACRDVANGLHSDVTVVRPAGVIMGVDQTRELVSRIGVMPGRSDWNVIVIEDADRLNEHADNALLKSLEEPPRYGVWVLCAPSADDVLPTIRSRCRVVRLRTPGISDVAAFLERTEGVDPSLAAYAARASQGHIGRARALATDETVRARHLDVLRFPQRLGGISSCLAAAGELVARAREQVAEAADPADAAELAEVLRSYGDGGTGAGSARSKASASIKELERAQRNRRRRMLRDELDRVLIDLTGLYRDALTVLTGADVDLINSAAQAEIDQLVAHSDPVGVLAVIDAIGAARTALASDGAEDLVLSQLAVAMRRSQLDGSRTGQVVAGRVP